MFASSLPIRFLVGVVVVLTIAVLLGIWAFRAFSGKKAWPGPGKVPRLHLRGEPRPNSAPVPAIAAPLCAEFLYFAVVLALDHAWHIDFGGTGPDQQTASQNILGLIFVIPLALLGSLGVSGRPAFLIPRQYMSDGQLNPSVVAMTRADAPAGSVMRPWLRRHTAVRLVLVTGLCVGGTYFGFVSLHHALAHQKSNPLWSTGTAVLYVVLWTWVVVSGFRSEADPTHGIRTFPSWFYSEVAIIFIAPFFVAFSQLPSRYGNSGIAIPIPLQVVGKSAMISAAIAFFLLSLRREILLRRGGSS